MTLDILPADSPVQLGLVGSLFAVPDEGTHEASLATLEEYFACYGAHIRTFKEDDTLKPRSFGDRERAYARRRLSKPGGDVWVNATGAPNLTQASSWQVKAMFCRERTHNLSGLWWSVSPTVEPGEARAFFLRAAAAGRYLHGNLGYGVVLPIRRSSMQLASPTSIALATRFVGLDVVDLMGTALYGKDGIKCVSWLTLIDDSLLEKLGGRDVVRHRLGPDILCYDLPNGLVVQAGSAPVLGDANRLDELAYYRHVAAVLKPIHSITLDGMDGLWDTTREMTIAWRRRFFEGARWP